MKKKLSILLLALSSSLVAMESNKVQENQKPIQGLTQETVHWYDKVVYLSPEEEDANEKKFNAAQLPIQSDVDLNKSDSKRRRLEKKH